MFCLILLTIWKFLFSFLFYNSKQLTTSRSFSHGDDYHNDLFHWSPFILNQQEQPELWSFDYWFPLQRQRVSTTATSWMTSPSWSPFHSSSSTSHCASSIFAQEARVWITALMHGHESRFVTMLNALWIRTARAAWSHILTYLWTRERAN